jgi:hypothetical protein
MGQILDGSATNTHEVAADIEAGPVVRGHYRENGSHPNGLRSLKLFRRPDYDMSEYDRNPL